MEFSLALAVALLVNLAVFVIAYLYQTDKLTDITYAFTFLAIACAVYFISPSSSVSLVVIAMVGLWAVRLGVFLGRRIHVIGRDKRFDQIRVNFWRFGRFWGLQGLSVWIIMIPSIYLISLSPDSFKALSAVGFVVWLTGLIIETIADNQKFTFTQTPANKGKWIESGLWARSRHPNYLGEMLVWVGLYLFALPYITGWAIIIALISPVWICGLLLFVTGIPTTEKSADKRWGKIPAYQNYKKRVPLLIPKL